MAARRGRTLEERIAAANADISAHFRNGDVRAALHRARYLLEAEAARVAGDDPARAALLIAALAGSLTAIASTLAAQQPLRPPGYRSGLPSARDLQFAYDTASTQTLQQGQRNHR